MSISKLSQLESYLCDATFSLHVNRVLAEAAPVYRALGERLPECDVSIDYDGSLSCEFIMSYGRFVLSLPTDFHSKPCWVLLTKSKRTEHIEIMQYGNLHKNDVRNGLYDLLRYVEKENGSI